MIDLLVKTTALLLVVTVATHLLRRRTAALRHLLWTFATVGLVAIPVLTRISPFSLPILPAAAPETAAPSSVASGVEPDAAATVRESRLDSPAPALATGADTPAAGGRAIPWAALFAALWAVGAAVMLARLGVGLVTAAGIARRARELTDERWLALADRCIRFLAVRAQVDIKVSDEVSMPFATGLVRPTIVLPVRTADWTQEQREAVLLHELSHVSRGDLAMNALSHVVRAAYWVNPLVWFAAFRLRVEGERACDDAVLRAGAKPSDYADHLLTIVRAVGGAVPNAALAMARRTDFEGRLLAILEPGIPRARLTRVRAAGLAALFLAVVMPLAAMTPERRVSGASGLTSERQDEEASLQGGDEVKQGPPAPLPAASGTVAALGEALQDENVSVRLAAVNSLGEIQDPAAITALARALKEDTDARVREAAAWALGEIDDNRAVPHLVEALRAEKSAKVREKIVRAIGNIDDATATPAVIGVLRDASPEVRRAAVETINELEDQRGMEALMGLVRDDDTEVRRKVAESLGHLENGAGIDALLTLTRDSDPEVRANAIESLGHFEGQRIVEAMVNALKDASPHVRERAADNLGDFENLRTAPRALIDALTDVNREVRRAAANSLGNIGDEAAVPALRRLVADNDQDTRRRAVEALKEIGGEEAIQALMGLLRDPDPEVRKTAAEALGKRRG